MCELKILSSLPVNPQLTSSRQIFNIKLLLLRTLFFSMTRVSRVLLRVEELKSLLANLHKFECFLGS